MVNPPLTAGSLNASPLSACINYNPDPIVLSMLPSGGSGVYSYQWKENGVDVGTNSPSYDPGNLGIAGTYEYYCVITDACGESVTTASKIITIINAVTATISGGGTYCENDGVNLTTTLSNGTGTYSYQWQSGVSVTGPWTNITSATNPTHSPLLTAGVYYYQIVVSSNEATCSDETASVTVNVNAAPTVTVAGPPTFCTGSNTILTANATPGSGSISSYQWNLNGTPIGGATSSTFIAGIAGNYSVTVTNSNGCKTTSAVMTVTETALPVSPGVTVVDNCDGTSTLTATGFSGSLVWSTNATSTTITVNTAAIYTVTQTVDGCVSAPSNPVTADPKNTPPAPITPANQTFCSSASPIVNDLASTGTNLQWYTSSTGGSPLSGTTALNAGIYYVSQTINGCESSRTAVTVAFFPPLNPGTHNTATITACINYDPDILNFIIPPSGGSSPYAYQWYLNGNPIPGATSSSYDPPSLLTANTYKYHVVVTDACGGAAATAVKQITVVPDVSVVITGGPFCQNVAANLTATLSNGTGPYTYQWQSGTSASGPWTDIPGATGLIYSPSTATIGTRYYQIKVSANGAACNDVEANVSITINPLPAPTITGPSNVCINSTGNVYTTQPGNTNYIWAISGGTITAGGSSSSNTATVTWNTAGTRSISVNYTDANGCTAASATSLPVTVNALPQ
jgi:hypothetical protein